MVFSDSIKSTTRLPLKMCNKKYDLYVIDDDSNIRKSFSFRFSNSSINVWPFASSSDFLESLPYLNPAPILLDIRMAGIDGLQLLEMLRDKAVLWPVVIMTAHGDVRVAVKSMRLGAVDIIEKPFVPEALDHVIDLAFRVLEEMENMRSVRDQARDRLDRLTRRESEVMAILIEGVANKGVAQMLEISVRTVEVHRANALTKLGVKSIAEVIGLATTAGLPPKLKGSEN